jgi:hypothetical protein
MDSHVTLTRSEQTTRLYGVISQDTTCNLRRSEIPNSMERQHIYKLPVHKELT